MWVKIVYWQTIWSQKVSLCIGSNLLKALLSSICVDQIWRRFNFHHFMMIIDPIEILENCDCKTLFYFQIIMNFIETWSSLWPISNVQVILLEINCAILYTNLHELFCQFRIWTNWVNPGKFLDNCWISCQVMADMKKVYDDLTIINLYLIPTFHQEIMM